MEDERWKKENQNRLVPTVLYVGVLILYAVLATTSQLLGPLQLAIVLVPMALGVVYYALENGIRKHFFLQQVPIAKLEEDEIIAFDELPKNIQEKWKMGVKRVMEKTDQKALEEMGIKIVPVYRNLPRFGPFLFVGLLVSLVIPTFVYAGFFIH